MKAILYAICNLLIFIKPVLAAEPNMVSAYAQYAGQLSNGQVYLELSRSVKIQGCESKRIILTSAHVKTQQEVILKVMRAQIFNKKMTLKLKGCNKGTPTINELNDLEIQ